MTDQPEGEEKPPPKRRSRHAKKRGEEGRRTEEAFNDAEKARRADVGYDTEKDRFVVRGKRGREHIFELDGEHTTSIDRAKKAHRTRMRKGRIRPLTGAEWKKFTELLQ
jgi:hypothetical protein